MGKVIQFKPKSEDLDATIELLDLAYGKMQAVQDELNKLEEATDRLQELYDEQLKTLAHRLGGIQHCPLDYLLYTSLDSETLKAMEEKLWKEIGSLSTPTNTTNT